ncbi:MAG: hypothetical protein AAF560_08615 [Acidobacteriota bacterium]
MKCKIHGLHYDPEMSTGCTRCLREAAKAMPKRPPQLVILLLCILGMAFILLYLFGPNSQPSDAGDLGVATRPEARIEKLDPEPYRRPIETLETVLFETPIDSADELLIVSSDISASASDLSARILDAEPTFGLDTADLIARMGQNMPLDQVAESDIERARNQWLRIRTQRLESADWYFDPARAALTQSTSVADYSEIASSLRSLIDVGLGEVQILSDPNLVLAEGESADDRWQQFTSGWRQQLASVESRLPARPGADADGRLLTAIQDLEQALSRARALVNEPNLPSATDSRFEEAMAAALRAQQAFDDLLP